MKGTGVEGGVIEQLRATVRIDVSAIPTASDTDNGTFHFFPDAPVVPWFSFSGGTFLAHNP